MMDLLRRYQYHIFLFTMAIFLGGMFVGFGGYMFSSKGEMDSVAEVNGDKIPLRLFYSHLQQSLDQVKPGEHLDEAARRQKRDETLRDLIQSMVFMREAQRYGIDVPDQQVALSLAQIPYFQENGTFSPRLYGQALQSQIHLSPADFEEEQRRALAFYKLRYLVQSSIKVTDKETELAYAQAHNGDVKNFEKDKNALRDQLLQQKTTWAFNQWFTQLGQHLKVKTHLDELEGRAK